MLHGAMKNISFPDKALKNKASVTLSSTQIAAAFTQRSGTRPKAQVVFAQHINFDRPLQMR